MAAPWEQFQPEQAEESGPWSKFRISITTGPQAPQEDMPAFTGGEEYGVSQDTQTNLRELPKASYNPILRGMIYDPIAAIREFVSPEQRKAVADEEAEYQKWRAEGGDTGFEWGRLAGGVLVPMPGAALLKGGSVASKAMRTALFGGAAAQLQPTFKNNEELYAHLAEKTGQFSQGVLFGSLMSLGTSGIAGISKFIGEVTKPLTVKGRQQLIADYLDKLVDPADRVKVINALENADQLVAGSRPTAAQALADTPQAANLAAAQRMQEGINPAPFRTREAEQAAAQRAAIEPFSDPSLQQRLEQRRDVITGQERTQALGEANRLGPTIQAAEARAQQAEQEAIALANQAPKQQQARTIAESIKASQDAAASGNAAAAKQAEAAMFRNQAAQLASQGRYFLNPQKIMDRIEGFMRMPGKRADPVLMRGLAQIGKEIQEQSRLGVIDANDLYQIRKNINQRLLDQFQTPQATPSAKVLAGYEKQIKGLIDAEIRKAAPSGMWDKYLQHYQKYSKLANQVQIGNYLKGKLGEAYITDVPNAGAFYNAVQDAAKTIQRAGVGGPRYDDLGKVMSGKQLKAIYAVRDDLQRIAKGKKLMGPSQAAGGDITSTPEFPQLLNQNIAIVNAMIRAVKKDAVGEMNAKLQEMFLNPKQLAAFMSMVPRQQADDFVSFLWMKSAPETRAAMQRALGTSLAVDLANRPDM